MLIYYLIFTSNYIFELHSTYVMYSQSLCIFTLFNIISQLHVVCCALGSYPGGGVFIYYYIIIKDWPSSRPGTVRFQTNALRGPYHALRGERSLPCSQRVLPCYHIRHIVIMHCLSLWLIYIEY